MFWINTLLIFFNLLPSWRHQQMQLGTTSRAEQAVSGGWGVLQPGRTQQEPKPYCKAQAPPWPQQLLELGNIYTSEQVTGACELRRAPAPGRCRSGTGGPGWGLTAAAAPRRLAPSPSQAVKWRLLPTGRRKSPLKLCRWGFSPLLSCNFACCFSKFLPITPLSLCRGCRAHPEVSRWGMSPHPGRVLQSRSTHLAQCPRTGQALPVPHQVWLQRPTWAPFRP